MKSIFVWFLGVFALGLFETASSAVPYDYIYMQYPSHNQPRRNITLGDGYYRRYGFLAADIDKCYESNTTNTITLSVPLGYYITVRFQYFEIECYGDGLSIREHPDAKAWCGYGAPYSSIYSSVNYMTFQFFTDNYQTYCMKGFEVVYTSFHYGECASNEFKCAYDGRCIPSEVKCDYYDNCGDWSDEVSGTCGLTTGAIIAISVTSALVGIACIAFIMYCIYDRSYRRNSRHHRRNSSSRNAVNATSTEPIPISSVEPIGPPKYADVPPSYAYIHSNPAFDGVYPTGDSANGVAPPPTYQSFVTPPYDTNT